MHEQQLLGVQSELEEGGREGRGGGGAAGQRAAREVTDDEEVVWRRLVDEHVVVEALRTRNTNIIYYESCIVTGIDLFST